jgi:hypothetical protein
LEPPCNVCLTIQVYNKKGASGSEHSVATEPSLEKELTQPARGWVDAQTSPRCSRSTPRRIASNVAKLPKLLEKP